MMVSSAADPLMSAPETIAANATSPSVAGKDGQFVVAYATAGSARLTWFGGKLDGKTLTIDSNGWNARITTGDRGFIVVWLRPAFFAFPQITSARVAADGSSVLPGALETGALRFEPVFDIAGRSNGAFVVAVDHHDPRISFVPLLATYEDANRVRAVGR